MTAPSPSHRALAARGPVRAAERRLAPDLARGAMLLFIALINAPGLAAGAAPRDARLHSIERLANVVLSLFVHARAYPVFAVMFGYSLVQLARRQEEAGADAAQVRTVLLRRNAWLIAFGFLHATLLYAGDFLGAYGIIGLVATVALWKRPRIQRALLWLWVVSIVEMIGLAAVALAGILRGPAVPASVPGELTASTRVASYTASIAARLHEWPMHTLTVIPAIFIVGLGMWAAERKLLEEAAAHRGLLRRIAWLGLGTAVAGGAPLALVFAGMLRVNPQTLSAIEYLHRVSGMFAGPGYAALIGLLSLRLSNGMREGSGRIAGALAALGQRSLSGYLFQSLAWQLLLPPYMLALGSRFGSPLLTSLGIALLVWLLSVVGATWLQRSARPGPAEVLLRRLTYGRSYGVRDHRPAPSELVATSS